MANYKDIPKKSCLFIFKIIRYMIERCTNKKKMKNKIFPSNII